MKCLYINLDRAPVRRASVESGFSRISPAGWTLERFPAHDGRDLPAEPGRCTPAEIACFRSHRDAIAYSLGDQDPVFVVEDDVVFSDRCFAAIEAKLARPGWDVMFTEVLPADPNFIAQLGRAYPNHVRRNTFEEINLAKRTFACSTAYVVNGNAKERLVGLLDAMGPRDLAYDIALRQFAREGSLKVGTIFPFVTTFAENDGGSQIQPAEAQGTEFVLRGIRQLFFVDRDLDACRRTSETLRRNYLDEHSRMVGETIGAMVSSKFETR